MGNSNETPAAQAGMTTAEARAAVRARREALARAERRHRECWDEPERLSNQRERLCDLTREDRARQSASLQLDAEGAKPECEVSAGCDRMAEEAAALKPPCTEPHAGQCRCPRSTTCRELRRRIAYLTSAVTQPDRIVHEMGEPVPTQEDFDELPTAWGIAAVENHMRKGGSTDESDPVDQLNYLHEMGEPVPTQEDFDELPTAWGIAAVENHMRKGGSTDESDPVDQLNYRRWLVELSQGALGYSGHLEHEMARHRIELEVLEQQAATVGSARLFRPPRT